ncbi:hypothetical protein [Geomicrobium sp. JCM 19039]|uniref:hypothetical protein n=1 Tax=Geomicrobium sp. JCM 19039 TaxID=1460636 RepID=UPI0005A95BBE|nr:hypothetical protein [Geomicrobium sp. JCM 19039]
MKEWFLRALSTLGKLNERHSLNPMTENGLYGQTSTYCLFMSISLQQLRCRSLFITARVVGNTENVLQRFKVVT